jgi:hypothetical protein
LPLTVGQRVSLGPVCGDRVSAIVRHIVDRVCGLEFLDLSEDQVKRIRTLCIRLPHYEGGATGI